MLTFRFVRFFRHLTPAVFKEILERTGQQRLPGLAAEMAYNNMLAMFPAVLAISTAVGFTEFSQQTLQDVGTQLSRVAPIEVVGLIQGFIAEISGTNNQGLFSISFAASLWASSGALSAAMNALDQIHQVPPDRVRPFWRAKLVSLALTIGTLQLLVLASVLIFISDVVVKLVATRSGMIEPELMAVWHLLSAPLALGIIAIAFAFIYRYGPSDWQRGTPLVPGAVLAALFWAILSDLFRLYVSQFGHYNRVYGAVGTVIVLLLWLQLSSLVMLMGAQLNVTVGKAMQKRNRPQTIS